MKVLRAIWHLLGTIAGAALVYWGVKDMNAAKTGIEVFKALFWLVVGGVSFHVSLNALRDGETW